MKTTCISSLSIINYPLSIINYMQTKDILKIAVQKSGRLSENSLSLLNECGITFKDGKNKLISPADNFPAALYFLRDDDIPQYVEDGVVDVGMVGENVFVETGAKIEIAKKLGFAKCRLSLAVPKADDYDGLQFLQNKRIATSYPNILAKYLKENGIKADLHTISGSVEIATGIGLADAICDLVSSGGTLLSNGLKEVQPILYSEAVLVKNKKLKSAQRIILESLIFRIESVQRAQKHKYILLNAPNEQVPAIIKLLPGMKSPTVLPLAMSGWSSVHTVVVENDFWSIIDQLKASGAQGILVVPIEKMVL
jgi:ATP phosphoribosyltransferase